MPAKLQISLGDNAISKLEDLGEQIGVTDRKVLIQSALAWLLESYENDPMKLMEFLLRYTSSNKNTGPDFLP